MDAQNPYDQGALDQGYDSYDQGVQGQNGPGWGNARKMNRQQRNRWKTTVQGLPELAKNSPDGPSQTRNGSADNLLLAVFQ